MKKIFIKNRQKKARHLKSDSFIQAVLKQPSTYCYKRGYITADSFIKHIGIVIIAKGVICDQRIIPTISNEVLS